MQGKWAGASGGDLNAALRAATTDHRPRTAAAFGRDDRPSTIDHGRPSSVVYGLWSEHRPPSAVIYFPLRAPRFASFQSAIRDSQSEMLFPRRASRYASFRSAIRDSQSEMLFRSAPFRSAIRDSQSEMLFRFASFRSAIRDPQSEMLSRYFSFSLKNPTVLFHASLAASS